MEFADDVGSDDVISQVWFLKSGTVQCAESVICFEEELALLVLRASVGSLHCVSNRLSVSPPQVLK